MLHHVHAGHSYLVGESSRLPDNPEYGTAANGFSLVPGRVQKLIGYVVWQAMGSVGLCSENLFICLYLMGTQNIIARGVCMVKTPPPPPPTHTYTLPATLTHKK